MGNEAGSGHVGLDLFELGHGVALLRDSEDRVGDDESEIGAPFGFGGREEGQRGEFLEEGKEGAVASREVHTVCSLPEFDGSGDYLKLLVYRLRWCQTDNFSLPTVASGTEFRQD